VGARRVEEIGAKNAIANVGSLEDTSASSASTSTKQVTTAKAKAKGKYKLKTRKAAAKRFKVTGNGKVMRRKQGKQHLNTKKKTKRKRFLSTMGVVEKGDIPNIKGSMPNHKIK
jgi:large subunit ribosomal protein L35